MSSKVKQDAAMKPLPRGRHKLSREEVKASQRSRLTAAMLAQVDAHGYEGTTVADVVAAAKVSRNAFYELFDDRQDCFIAACDELQRGLLNSLYEQAAQPSWLEALSRGLDLYLDFWTRRPGFAVVYVVEFPTAGRRAVEQRDRAYERFALMFEALAARARAEQPRLDPLPALTPRILVTAITELIAQEVRAGRGDDLGALREGLFRFIVMMLADEATARRVAGSTAER
jgi:AcrR family transcriptional regulator